MQFPVKIHKRAWNVEQNEYWEVLKFPLEAAATRTLFKNIKFSQFYSPKTYATNYYKTKSPSIYATSINFKNILKAYLHITHHSVYERAPFICV